MSYSDNKEQWFRDIIMDHYQTPRNKGLVETNIEQYINVHLKNPSCGDDLIIQVKMSDHQIADIHFEGSGCAICCASASMLTENVKGHSVEDAIAYIQAFSQMVSGMEINEDVLQDAVALQGVAKLPPRIKCATLGCKALEKAITGEAVNDQEIEEN